MKLEIIAALQVLKKVLKIDKKKIVVTLDGEKLDRGDLDVHPFRFDLEAWRDSPKEYYCTEVPYFHPKSPQLTVNGEERFYESIDADLHGDRIALEVRFAEKADPAGTIRTLAFTYPYL